MELWGKSCLEKLEQKEQIPAWPLECREPPEPWLSLLSFLPLLGHLLAHLPGPPVRLVETMDSQCSVGTAAMGTGCGGGRVCSKAEAGNVSGTRGERWPVRGSLTGDVE